MLKNLRLIWKFAILALMIPLTALVIGAFALQGVSRLKYEYDNLYEFMLKPIIRLDEGNLSRETLARNIVEFRQESRDLDIRHGLSESIQQHDAEMAAAIDQYEKEYQSSLNAEFSATLASLGKSDLQTAEAAALEQFHTHYAAYAPLREALLANEYIDLANLQSHLDEIGNSFAALGEINREYADLSNVAAQAAIVDMRLKLILAGVAATVLSLLVAAWLTRLVTGTVNSLTAASLKLSEGDLDVNLPRESGDELGQMTMAYKNMVAYMQEVSSAARRIAANDLTGSVTPKSEKDVLSHAFVEMTANLREVIGQVIENAAMLDNALSELSLSANQAGLASSQIAATIQQVSIGIAQQTESVAHTATSIDQMGRAIDGLARGAQDQSASVEQASHITSQLTGALQGVAGNADAVSAESGAAATSARAGAATVQQTLEGMRTIKETVDRSARKVAEMGHRSQEVGAIVATIEDIASQTNLLALNAAIEAARAGEQGKGFAVVADEVRKLAERAATATREIGSLITGIQSAVGEAVEAMNTGVREIDRGVEQAGGAQSILEDILKASESVNQQAEQAALATREMGESAGRLVQSMEAVSAVVEQNTAATEEMGASSGDVTQAIETIASVSEENSAAVEEVSAGAEEMSAQVEEVTAAAGLLAEMARELHKSVSRFNI